MHAMHIGQSPMIVGSPSTLLRVLLVLLIAGQVYPQNDECLNRTTVVTILGVKGNNVKGPIHPTLLTPADLRAKVGGDDAMIESLTHPSGSLRIVVILDIGAGQNKSTWEVTRFILHNFPLWFAQGTESHSSRLTARWNRKVASLAGSMLWMTL